MTSFLIDAVLVGALLVTSWRTGSMYRELRRLRGDESALRAALVEADQSINRAANAVILLKTEGVQTLRSLEERMGEAQELTERLDIILDSYERRRAQPANDVDALSRFASVPAAIR
ncbi:DUF6468 domain-containing protein [Aureimonas sp. AU20]|uniref:DUF6468 domain-containing protein n=1 Tax=Aureimonas sp. AU20 TaxID=1349819 RepID=UPI00072035E6|nr:DUF6468 domain-containing protein [Aureimonas sp. AU20]ALN74169.1 hypothetical protein M673_15685 [Aureimonas sp. AU20]